MIIQDQDKLLEYDSLARGRGGYVLFPCQRLDNLFHKKAGEGVTVICRKKETAKGIGYSIQLSDFTKLTWLQKNIFC